MIILDRQYYAENINDAEQDIGEAIETIPNDEDGFKPGCFKIIVEWVPND